jgi:hypothetical protein
VNYKLLHTPEALNDIEEAIAWYEIKQTGLGSEFAETVLDYLEYLTRNAHSHPAIRAEYRELVIKNQKSVESVAIFNQKSYLCLHNQKLIQYIYGNGNNEKKTGLQSKRH